MEKLTATGRFSIAHVWLTEDKSKKHREETISTKKRSLSTNWIYHILYSIDDFSGPVVYGIFDKTPGLPGIRLSLKNYILLEGAPLQNSGNQPWESMIHDVVCPFPLQ